MNYFLKRNLSILVFFIFASNSFSQKKFEITCGPYLQQVSETEATFIWMTNEESIGWVEIAPDDSSHFYHAERPRYYNTYLGKKYLGTMHKVNIKDFEPGTTYRYRVFSQQAEPSPNGRFVLLTARENTKVYKVDPLKFTTLDTSKDNFSFAVINDIHENNELQTNLLKDVKNESVDFVVFNGDMVNDMRSVDKITNGFLKTASKLFASEIPIVMVRGNHEPRGVDAQYYMDFFPSETNMPYYSFRHGNCYFIALDSGEDKTDQDVEYDGLNHFDDYRTEQVKWLQQEVNSEAFKNAKHRIVFMHMPPLTDHWHGPSHANQSFIPILNEAKIDLMLSGHLHKHWYIEPNYQNCNFPILVNSNKNKTRVEVSNNGIRIKVVNEYEKPVFEKTLNK